MPDAQLSKWLPKFQHDIVGIRFALNVFIATSIVWYALANIADTNPIWAIASMIAASDPAGDRGGAHVQEPHHQRAGRLRRRPVLSGRRRPERMEAAVRAGRDGPVSSYVIHIPTMWRQAPITAAIVIAAGLTAHSKLSGVEHGLHKVAEVLFGCFVGLMVSWLMSKVWPIAKPADLGSP